MTETRTAIDDLMVTAGRCMTRAAPLPPELIDDLRREGPLALVMVEAELDDDFSSFEQDLQNGAFMLLVQSSVLIIELPKSQHALTCLHAARNLIAAMRAEKAMPGTEQADPSFWWTKGAIE